MDHVPGDDRRHLVEVSPDQMKALLAYAMADLAMLRLRTDEIEAVWRASGMPLPAFVEQRYLDGRRDLLVALLRHRFGPDDRTSAAAEHLSAIHPAEAVARVGGADDLDSLFDP
jgi:hypothetical protein